MLNQSERISLPLFHCNAIKEAFRQYTQSFHKSGNEGYNRHMEIKQLHTARVCEEITSIGYSLGFDAGQLAFAQVIAWLHDIGRFEQFDKYGTFADAESENHAEIALRVIENKCLLKDFDPTTRKVIYRSILNHNVPQIPDNYPNAIDFYSRLLRDADKLDIWRIALEMNIFNTIKTEPLPAEYTVPEKLVACFTEGKIITLDKVESLYDSVLFRLSWVYDLNFRYTIEQVIERKIVRKLLAKLPPSVKLDFIESRVNSFMIDKLSRHGQNS
jgi:hypothetical protein